MLHTPVNWILREFGGVSNLSRHLGISASAVSQWKKSGEIPKAWFKQILSLSKSQRLDVTLKDLVWGRIDES